VLIVPISVADPDLEYDPDPEGSQTFSDIQVRSETEINVLDRNSNLDKKKFQKEPYIQAKIRYDYHYTYIFHIYYAILKMHIDK
jgi:hypothetical protein